MRNDVVFIILSEASRRASDEQIISAVYQRLGVTVTLADVETVLNVNEWLEVAA